ncbi:hypothetical protein [Actinomadura litoris]|uniref:hypothetical protein n=1 Tax=Actinomadura litoris TaxID=2678616 RepID=UPI001FA80ABB|nr:hypothetical protein [Actinomadura litoris]
MNATVEKTPRPSQAETLRAEYGDTWDIWREVLPGGGHGDWIAERLSGESQTLRADNIAELADLLREARS